MDPIYKNNYLQQYDLTNMPYQPIVVSVSNPTQVKTTISSYTVYKVSGSDSQGQFECSRRYSDFDHLRNWLLKKWPGCFIPPLPKKKLVGNSDSDFIQIRKKGLNYFCLEMVKLRHLWYSQQFQVFLRRNGDVQVNMKSLASQTHEDIIKKYDEKLPKISGKCSDTLILAKVIQFHKYVKRTIPLITNFKLMIEGFVTTQRSNNQQYSLLYNYLLPQYQRACLTPYLNLTSDGKVIFIDENDDKLAKLINNMKQVLQNKNFEELYEIIDLEERQLQAFVEVYKGHQQYESKITELRKKEKDMEIQLQELNAGKQGFFKSIFKKGNIEESKQALERDIANNKDLISTYGLLSDLIVIILGFFEIDRFKEDKFKKYKETLKNISKIQIEFAKCQREIYTHILDNHNLM